MTKVTQLIAEIEDLRSEEETAQAELKRVQDRIQQETDKLRVELATGGTTKDPVYDLVLKVGGGVDDPALPKYRELRERLKGKKGEFVMILYHAKVRFRYGGRSSDSDYRHETHFRIGFLAGEELRLGTALGGSPVITLPVDCYRQGTWPASRVYGIHLEENHPNAPPQKDFLEWRGGDDYPPILLEYLINEHLSSSFVIGDEAFRA